MFHRGGHVFRILLATIDRSIDQRAVSFPAKLRALDLMKPRQRRAKKFDHRASLYFRTFAATRMIQIERIDNLVTLSLRYMYCPCTRRRLTSVYIPTPTYNLPITLPPYVLSLLAENNEDDRQRPIRIARAAVGEAL